MKDIAGYEGLYAITSCGKVYSYKNKRFLKPSTNRRGYLYVALRKDRKQKKFLIHRLVAETYIPNPDSLETVDHINECKTHNYINNLRWMSRGENKSRSWSKRVKCIETNEVFESTAIAAKKMNLSQGNISSVCCGKRNHAGGYHFEYI